ncbi:MAG: zinc-binding dehydrogenase [Gammaproteobacteria bacterium]|nr:zinc-binding dehydrogenase [Gammaproteobacteria bacterium]
MRAAVYQGSQQLAIEVIPDPSPGPGQVVIDVNYCAICGTDVHHFLYDVAPPGTVMGHEYSGVVSAVGDGVIRWSVGDRVVGGGGEPPPEVRAASPNRGERYNYRLDGFSGPSSRVRAYAEKVLLEEWEPVPVPDGVTDEEAAMCEPCAVTVHAVRLSQLKLGDSVVVLSAGPIGLLCAQVARAAGASKVIVSEPAPARAEAARRLGMDAVINPLEEDAEQRVVELTDGNGPDVVFECAAAKGTLDQARNMARRNGQGVLVAIVREQTPVLPPDWMAREVSLKTSFGTQPEDWRIALDLIRSGKGTMEPLVSEARFLPLDEIQGAFEALCNPSNEVQMVVRHG